MALIIAIIIVLVIVSCMGQGAAKINLKHDNQRSMEECRKNQAEWAKRTSKEKDIYYNPVSGTLDFDFYSDGSLRHDPYTKREYGKGAYRCNSRGYNAQRQQASSDEKRPPAE